MRKVPHWIASHNSSTSNGDDVNDIYYTFNEHSLNIVINFPLFYFQRYVASWHTNIFADE